MERRRSSGKSAALRSRNANTISANPEDSGGYRAGGGGKRRRSPGGTGGNQAPRSIGVNLILAILVAGLMVAGWFLANQHQQLRAEQAALASAEERLVVLEDRLRITDEAMSLTDKDTQNKIGFWEDEIRKLWAVTNERNKKWIKANENAVAKHRKSITSLESSQGELKLSLQRQTDTLAKQQVIVDQLDGLGTQVRQVLSTQRDLVDKVNAARQAVASLEAGLGNRVAENEQAVKAIDSYRLQLNNRLSSIEQRLSSSGASPSL